MCYAHTSVRVSRLGPPHTLRLRPRHEAPRRVRSTPRLREPQLTASSHHASHYHTTPPPTRASTPYARRQIHARSPRALLGGGGLGGGEEQHGGRDALVGVKVLEFVEHGALGAVAVGNDWVDRPQADRLEADTSRDQRLRGP